jgi:surface antigen
VHDQYDHLHYVRDARGNLRCSGDKWQALEYARRWWITHLDVYLPHVEQPHELLERNFVKRLADGARVDLQFHDGSSADAIPAVHDLILWKQTNGRPFGHVAVVVEVGDNYIRVAEQNADNAQWSESWSRQLAFVRDAQGAVSIQDDVDPVHGWVRVLQDKVLPPIPWKAPDDDRTAVDGDYGMGTTSILQKFLGMKVNGQHDRLTDNALAAFLNTHAPGSLHVPAAPEGKEHNRVPLITKLQQFLNEHPLISGSGTEGIEIKENGVWDSATIKGVQNLINRVTHADEFAEAAHVYKSGGGPPPRPNLPHGVLLGEPKFGVKSYNCNYQNMIPPGADEPPFDMLTYVKDSRGNLQYSGMKWQCVEYARRWWVTHYDVTLLNIPRACDIWNRTYVKRLSDSKNVALEMHASGTSTEPPRVGDLIIWKKTEEQPVGHVAVVCDVTENAVRIGEQNVDNNLMWSGGFFSREFPLQRNVNTGAYTMRDDEDPLFGWVRVHPERVVDTPPWNALAAMRLAVDGVMTPETTIAWQKFVGVDVKNDLGDVDLSEGSRWATIIGRMTDYATAAFLNVAHQQYPHVYMQSFMAHMRQPIVTKLQNFLNSYPELTGAGPEGLLIAESGEWDEPTTKAIQNLLNKVEHYEDLEAAVSHYRPK